MQYAIATITKLFNFARSASEIIGGCNCCTADDIQYCGFESRKAPGVDAISPKRLSRRCPVTSLKKSR